MTLHHSLHRRQPRAEGRTDSDLAPSDALVDGRTGEVVVNSLRDVRFAPTSFQVMVCDHCFHAGCASGGWVVARRYGACVVWIPDFTRTDAGAWEASMFGPPWTSSGDGCRVFANQAVQAIEQEVSEHPRRDELPMVTTLEAVKILHDQAPGHFLRWKDGTFELARELALAADPFELDDVLVALEAAVANPLGHLEVPPSDAVPATLYLDLDDTPPWTPIGRAPDGRWFLLPFGTDSLACGSALS